MPTWGVGRWDQRQRYCLYAFEWFLCAWRTFPAGVQETWTWWIIGRELSLIGPAKLSLVVLEMLCQDRMAFASLEPLLPSCPV